MVAVVAMVVTALATVPLVKAKTHLSLPSQTRLWSLPAAIRKHVSYLTKVFVISIIQ
jgi:hypothetical protein